MFSEPIDSAFSPARSIFKRCKQCETSSPACPVCPEGSICTMTAPSCDECATTKCVSTGSKSSDDEGPNTGAIAGGVVGGVAAVAIIVFLIWWFVIRKKRQERQESQEAEKNDSFAATRSERQSIASTVLTRASNVIQIAYIPGVTNRSPPETPATLVPPVPPLPGATPDQHFFMPGDLRDSSWTTTTGHQSISPTLRSSVATTIYRNDAIVSAVPAQQIQRSRAAMVSIHNGGSGQNAPGDDSPVAVTITPADAPAVPAITQAQLARAEGLKGNSSCVARSVIAKPVMVRGPSVKKKDTNNPPVNRVDELPENGKSNNSSRAEPATGDQFGHNISTFDGSSSDEEDTRSSSTANLETGSARRHNDARRFSGLSDTRNSTRTPPARVESPFSDANEVK